MKTCDNVRGQSAYAMHGFSTYFRHAQTFDNVPWSKMLRNAHILHILDGSSKKCDAAAIVRCFTAIGYSKHTY